MTFLLLFILCANLLLLGVIYFTLPRRNGWLFLGLCIFFPGVSFAIYANLGQAWLGDNPLQASNATTQNNADNIALSREAQQTFAALSPSERAARIQAMVGALSQRLHEDGGEPQEWLRLARAQSVLGEKAQARAALEQAEKQFPALARKKAWLAASIAILLASPLDVQDKRRIKNQLQQAKEIIGTSDMDIKGLEQRLTPLLK